MLQTNKVAIALVAATGITLSTAANALAATFRYTTLANRATYTEGATTVLGADYDGTFVNIVANPFTGIEQTFEGFYRIESGTLGTAVALRAVQQSPTNRTALGSEGITQIKYLSVPQPVSTVPGAFSIPPTLTDFDFKFVPAAVSGAPTVLSKGWTAESVPEPATALSLLTIGLIGTSFGVKRSTRSVEA